MHRLIAILTSCSLALAVSVQAAKPDAAKPAAKPKSAPKQQQPAAAPKVKAPKKAERVVPSQTDWQVRKSDKPAKVKKDKSKAPDPKVRDGQDALKTNVQEREQLEKTKVKVHPNTVKKIRAQHVNFKAQPNTSITSAQFNPNYRIEAAQNWAGPQYNVFRLYQPVWHDRGWWSSHYTTVSLIAGGWYYWDAGYWYPAWGYDEAAAYYPYDGPIYVGSSPRPFDQVVADVQGLLQDMGFYKGEVDGLVGPLTREAVAAYQSSQGLPATAAIDQPTLDSLGLS